MPNISGVRDIVILRNMKVISGFSSATCSRLYVDRRRCKCGMAISHC
jgi:hypothetical protein